MAGRRRAALAKEAQRGAALLIFLILLVMGGLTYVVNSFSPETIEARRAQKTNTALMQARDALVGYALQYRDAEVSQGRPNRMYGYLPLPDLGSSRNINVSCSGEGCDANTFTGLTFDTNGIGPTVVGRFPWRTLGTGPLRDGHGECLWMMVSSLHGRIHGVNPVLPPMNWDTLGQLDIVVANGSNALVSALASDHDRPVAVIFAPGPPLPGQNRNPSSTDDVGQCGGNYVAANYLDPATASALGGVTNYLSGTNLASGATGDSDPANDPDTPKSLVARGKIFSTGSAFLPNGCQGSNCALVANDVGLPITGDHLFGAIRKNVHFRTDINSMLDRMTGCLRDQIAASSSFTPAPITGYTAPADKSAGRIQASACYDDNLNPLGYFSHYKEMLFVAKPTAGNFTVAGDPNCAGVLLFAGQRSTTQQRIITTTQKNTPANYLEGNNLTSFTGAGSTFSGDLLLDRSPPQTVGQDIARCIPTGASLNQVASPALNALGGQLTAYDPASRTLTLGRLFTITDPQRAATAGAFFGCSWMPETRQLLGRLHSYFRFKIIETGHGFTFAIIDGSNNSNVCGADGAQLGYSGNNLITPMIAYPKIALEIDTSKQTAAYASSGRADPDYDGGHVAFVYWGSESAMDDDNVHGLPTPPDTSARPAPRNPPPEDATTVGSGIARLSTRSIPTNVDIHVRIEVKRMDANDVQHFSSYQVDAWIEKGNTKTDVIAAMRNTTRPFLMLYPSGNTAVDIYLHDEPTIYDTQGGACSTSSPCPLASQVCGTDSRCYARNFSTARLGFTASQSSTSSSKDQIINISDFFTTWLP